MQRSLLLLVLAGDQRHGGTDTVALSASLVSAAALFGSLLEIMDVPACTKSGTGVCACECSGARTTVGPDVDGDPDGSAELLLRGTLV
jgi:hypothetical protein